MLLNTIGTIVLVILCLMLPVALVLAVGYWVFEGWFSFRKARKETEANRQSWETRFGNVAWEALAKKYGCRVPDALIKLYDGNLSEPENIIVAQCLDAPEDKQWFIAYFYPVDSKTWGDREKFFEFANDGGGNGYIVDPRMDDPPVFFYDHEGGTFKYVCDTLSEFITWPQLPSEDE